MTLLYRLLFLLYAESRNLLPIGEPPYHAASLKKIKEEIADKAGMVENSVANRLQKAYPSKKTILYDRLCRLFRVLDKGDPILNLPACNSGLFNTTPLPLEHRVPDCFLALAVDRLAREEDEHTHTLAFIDYQTLAVRHLGAIHEGLQEFKLEVGEEVQLVNSKSERKASGSYYTPDDIVKYIVANTVGPVLEEKLTALRPEFLKVRKTFANELRKSKTQPSQEIRTSKLDHIRWAVWQTCNAHMDLVDKLFDFRALDPAMGSAYFLVEAVNFITDRLLKFLKQFPINPVNFALERTRTSFLESLGEQGIRVEPANLTDIHLLKRHCPRTLHLRRRSRPDGRGTGQGQFMA